MKAYWGQGEVRDCEEGGPDPICKNEDINIGKQQQAKYYQGLEHPDTRGELNGQYRLKPKTAMARIA